MSDDLASCHPYLQQGDVFKGVRCPVPDGAAGQPTSWSTEERMAILLTADCQIDKKATERLHFSPVMPTEDLDGSMRSLLREHSITPYDGLVVGEIDGVEHYCRLSYAFWTPITRIGESKFEQFFAGEPPSRSIPDAQRVGTLSSTRRNLLQDKLNAFWTGRVPSQPTIPDAIGG